MAFCQIADSRSHRADERQPSSALLLRIWPVRALVGLDQPERDRTQITDLLGRSLSTRACRSS